MIEGLAGATTAQSGTGANGLGALDGEAFLKLMVAQLRYQNPLEPTDASTMMQQTAAFTQVETLQKLAGAQQTMLGMSEALMASGLVGKSVAAVRPDDTVLHGGVEGVRFTAEGPMLSIGGEEVALAAIVQIGEPVAADPAVPSTPAPSTPESTTPAPSTPEARGATPLPDPEYTA